MSRKHRPSRADRKPVTRRYLARMFGRLRDDLVSAVIFAEAARVPEPPIMVEPWDARNTSQPWPPTITVLSETTTMPFTGNTAGKVS